MMRDNTRRRAGLADFLRTRRARLHPEEFGFPALAGRRAPGLRREELAQLMGVGVSWYTWFEQGRDIHVSAQVLERLADVLRLDEAERGHLFTLARGTLPLPEPQESTAENAAYQAILDALGICPAYLLDYRLNVVAWNESARRVIGDFASRSERERNLAWQTFVLSAARQRFANWEHAARQCMAMLRAKSDQYAGDKELEALIADLQQASPEFRAWWPRHDMLLPCNGSNTIMHPLVGQLALRQTVLAVPERPEWQMVVYTPLPQVGTEARLKALMKEE